MITLSTSATTTSKAGYHHGDLAKALLEAALGILEEGGDPASLSLRETARRAGVSAMAPYRHFADKDALLAGVRAIGFERLAVDLAEADARSFAAAGADEAVIAQGVAYVRFACANPALFRLMFATASSPGHAAFREAADRAFSILAGRVGTLTTRERIADVTLRNWATVHGLASLLVDGQIKSEGAEPAAIAERILRLG